MVAVRPWHGLSGSLPSLARLGFPIAELGKYGASHELADTERGVFTMWQGWPLLLKAMYDIAPDWKAENARYLAEIIASSGDAIIGQTFEGILTCWNDTAGQMLGWTKEEILGHPVAQIVPVGRRPAERRVALRIRAGARVVHAETERRRRDGTVMPVFVTFSPILRAGDGVIGISTILRDLSSLAVEGLPQTAQELLVHHEQNVDHTTVLLVEDDGSLLEMLAGTLRADGHDVIIAGDALTALGLLDLHPEVGVVVSDIVMPNGVSGLLLAHEAQRLRPNLPVLLMSGYAPEDLERLGSTTGFPFLAKPFRPHELTTQVRQLLN